ncbi:MAG: hypothetical protein AB1898_33090 [Acidobacteriota bacterium]
MTRSRRLEQLLNELPDDRLPELLDFLQRLAGQSKTPPDSEPLKGTSRSRDTFGLIQAEPALVRQVLAEDFYDLG